MSSSKKRRKKDQQAHRTERNQLEPEAPGISTDEIEASDQPDENEERIVADPEGARRYGNTKAS